MGEAANSYLPQRPYKLSLHFCRRAGIPRTSFCKKLCCWPFLISQSGASAEGPKVKKKEAKKCKINFAPFLPEQISTCTKNGKIHSVGSEGVRAQGTPRAARLQQLSPGGPATLSNGIRPRFQCLDLSSWLWQNVPMKCFC